MWYVYDDLQEIQNVEKKKTIGFNQGQVLMMMMSAQMCWSSFSFSLHTDFANKED